VTETHERIGIAVAGLISTKSDVLRTCSVTLPLPTSSVAACYSAALHISLPGTKRTFCACRRMSVLGGKTVMQWTSPQRPILIPTRHVRVGLRSR